MFLLGKKDVNANSKPIEIRASWIALGLIFAPAVLGWGEIQNKMEYASEIRHERRIKQQRDRLLDTRAQDELDLSALALKRVSGGCIPMFVQGSDGKPVTLQPGMAAYNSDGQRLIDGIGCSADGSTAEIWQGAAHGIARVSAEDRAKYDELYAKLNGKQK